MTFLQPILLVGLPLMALPIVIHLIHRQRHQTVAWGPMLFLLDAKRMTRGMARLRHWLILALRSLAIAALCLAAARPLASGRVGLALGGAPDTAIVILDRSASMEQQSGDTRESKRSAGLRKIVQLMRTLGGTTRLVLIENGANRAEMLDSADAILQLPSTSATDASADIPAMLQTALDYVRDSQTGRTDIWICSDLRACDWRVDDGRWSGLRDGFAELDGVTFYLLSYRGPADDNLAVWVDRVRCRTTERETVLTLDVTIRRPATAMDRRTVPLEFIIDGARSVQNVELTTGENRLQGYTIPLDGPRAGGWGRVELPADSNPRDNVYFFVFGQPEERRTVIVSDDPATAEPLRIAAASPVDSSLAYSAIVAPPEQLATIDWPSTCLIVWQAALPDQEATNLLETFVDSGRPLLFFPPATISDRSLWGLRWAGWQEAAVESAFQVASWRGDSDLLQHTDSGAPLPVGRLQIYRYCRLEGNGRTLAALADGNPLLVRTERAGGSAYFFTTLPSPRDSSLLRDGIVFYVVIQRALAIGAESSPNVHQLAAGSEGARKLSGWSPQSEVPGLLSTQQPLLAGVYRKDEHFVALNRPVLEDDPVTIGDDAVDRLFQGLHYQQVNEEIGGTRSLASEIWRAMLLLMAGALVVEAWLCVPRKHRF